MANTDQDVAAWKQRRADRQGRTGQSAYRTHQTAPADKQIDLETVQQVPDLTELDSRQWKRHQALLKRLGWINGAVWIMAIIALIVFVGFCYSVIDSTLSNV